MQCRGKYPVIFLSMKMAAAGGRNETFALLKAIIARLYRKYLFLEASTAIDSDEKDYYARVRRGRESCTYDDLALSMCSLSNMLYKYYGIKPVILIDEYDAPIQYAWENGFYDEMIKFMRQFYSEALKGNEALEFAVLTGVLRVAKESIFSWLNNVQICSVLSDVYNDTFGFTAEEVAKMASDLHCEEKLPELKEWYDGYNFGGREIYNPWSIVQYFWSKCRAAPYWVNTSGNGIIKYLLFRIDSRGREELQALMAGDVIRKNVQDSVIYDKIGNNPDDLYTMLLTTGYLKCIKISENEWGEELDLQIPNREIFRLFIREITQNLTGYHGVSDVVNMLREMPNGNSELFEADLSRILRNAVSYHDAANGESFYHGMMLGFCVLLKNTHIVESNRESGYGRFDVALIPVDERYYGVILEFKRIGDESQLEEKALEALAQIDDLSYIAEFEKRQIKKVWKYGIAFCGKRMCLRGA